MRFRDGLACLAGGVLALVCIGTSAQTAPTVSLTNPTGNIEIDLGESVQLRASVNDPDGDEFNVSFYANGSPYTDWSAPWSVNWTPSSPGTYTIFARARDSSQLSSDSNERVTVTVRSDNSSPTVTLTSPTHNSVYVANGATARVTLRANASDVDGNLQFVYFKVGNRSTSPDTSAPFSGRIDLAPGTYQAHAVAVDSLNAVAQSPPVTLRVDGISPPPIPAAINVPGQNVNTNQFVVSWSASPGATHYTLDESKDGGPWLIKYNSSGTSTTVTVTEDGTYQYRVRARNSAGYIGFRYSSSVTVNLPSLAPATLISPDGTGTEYYGASGTCFDWAPVPGATHYNVQVGLIPDLLVSRWVRYDVTSTSACWDNGNGWVASGSPLRPVSEYQGDGTRYWRVRALNGPTGSDTDFSLSDTVAYALSDTGEPLPPASITVPTYNVNEPVFAVSWPASPGAEEYVLEISYNTLLASDPHYASSWSDFDTIKVTTDLSTDVDVFAYGSQVLYQMDYRFRVRARNAAATSEPSPVSSVVNVNLPSPIPVNLLSPLEGTTVAFEETGNCFSWAAVPDATAYVVQVWNTNGPVVQEIPKWRRQVGAETTEVCWNNGDGFEEPLVDGVALPASEYRGTDTRYWRVRVVLGTFGEVGYQYSFSDVTSFNLNSVEIPASITVPEYNLNVTSFNVSWDPTGAGEIYLVEWSSDGGISWHFAYEGVGTLAEVVVPGGGTYLVRVRAKEGEDYSLPLVSQQVQVNLPSLGAANLLEPASEDFVFYGETGNCFHWDPVDEATSYVLQVWKDPGTNVAEVPKWRQVVTATSVCWEGGNSFESVAGAQGQPAEPIHSYAGDGVRYWRVRALKGAEGEPGYEFSLSDVNAFYLLLQDEPGFSYHFVDPLFEGDTPSIYALLDNTQVFFENSFFTVSAGEPVDIGSVNVGDQIASTQPLSIGSSKLGADVPVPAEFAGTDFILPLGLDGHSYFLKSALDEPVNFDLANGSATSTQTIEAGQVLQLSAAGFTDVLAPPTGPVEPVESVVEGMRVFQDVSELDFSGEFVYAVNFEGGGSVSIEDATFSSVTYLGAGAPAGMTVQGFDRRYSWNAASNLGSGAGNDALETLMGTKMFSYSIATGKITLQVEAGETYKLQMLIGEGYTNSRHFLVEVEAPEFSQSIVGVGLDPNSDFRNSSTQGYVITKQVTSDDGLIEIDFSRLSGGDGAYNLSALTLERYSATSSQPSPFVSAPANPAQPPDQSAEGMRVFESASELDFSGLFTYAVNFEGGPPVSIMDAAFTSVSRSGAGAPAGMTIQGFNHRYTWNAGSNLGSGPDDNALETVLGTKMFGYQTATGKISLQVEPGETYKLQLLIGEGYTNSRNYRIEIEAPAFAHNLVGVSLDSSSDFRSSTTQGYVISKRVTSDDGLIEIDFSRLSGGDSNYHIGGLTLEKLQTQVDDVAGHTALISNASGPLLVSYRSDSSPASFPLVPVAQQLLGLAADASLVGASPSGATVDARSAGTLSTIVIDPSAKGLIEGPLGETSAVLLDADAGVSAASYDVTRDSIELGFWPISMLANRFVLPVDARDVMVACSGAEPVIVYWRDSTGLLVDAAPCSPANPGPGLAVFGESASGQTLSAGSWIETPVPGYLAYESLATGGMRNLAGAIAPLDQVQPAPPTGDFSTGNLEVAWEAIPGATGYLVEISANGGVSWVEAYSGTQTTAPIVIEAGGSYLYRLSVDLAGVRAPVGAAVAFDVSLQITTQYRYDPLGRLIKVEVPDKPAVEYNYDKADNRKSVVVGGEEQ